MSDMKFGEDCTSSFEEEDVVRDCGWTNGQDAQTADKNFYLVVVFSE